MAVCRCSVCGAKQVTRSQFEVDCDECGAEEALVPEDAYDPEPSELRCSRCGYEVEGGGQDGERDKDYAGAFTVEDPCPRCRGDLVPKESWRRPGGGDVRDQPEKGVARAVARRLLSEKWGRGLPVDVEELARASGLEIHRGHFNHEGLLRGTVIEVPVDDAATAQRFAIAHELAHHLLRHQVPQGQIEIEANAFASELLMPREQLQRAVADGLGLDEIRDRFRVSRDALHWALQDARLLGRVAG